MFESLDFIYIPTPDMDGAIAYYVTTLGATLDWKIRHFGTVVAHVRVSDNGPALLLAGHLEGSVPILIYKVANLDTTMEKLKSMGWQPDGDKFEIPHGPCINFKDPSGQRYAMYQRVRPGADDHFKGRIDD